MTPARPTDRAFGFTFAILFAVVFLAGWLLFSVSLLWAVIVSLLFAILAVIYPLALLPFNRLWTAFAGWLGKLNNRLLLGVVFYGLILPTGMALRLLRKGEVRHLPDPSLDSYLTAVMRKSDKESFYDQF